jgi:hypothetical protein
MQGRDSSRAIAFARARRAAQHWVDDYAPRGKLYPAVCTHCGVAEWRGHWRWGEVPPDLAPVVCPACERIRDGAAAHVLKLVGDLPRWWGEVHGMIRNVAHAETREHPLERVMAIDVRDDCVLVPTTGMHMARRLAAAIVRRFRHHVRLTFAEKGTTIEWLPVGA